MIILVNCDNLPELSRRFDHVTPAVVASRLVYCCHVSVSKAEFSFYPPIGYLNDCISSCLLLKPVFLFSSKNIFTSLYPVLLTTNLIASS